MDDDALREMTRLQREEIDAAGETVFSRRRIIAIADWFGERPMDVVSRMEKLGLLKSGSYRWFQINGGITNDHVQEARCDREAVEDDLLANGTHYLTPDGKCAPKQAC